MKTSLHFRKLRYQNFLSTGNSLTEIDLDAYPMTLVVGDNGEGKSTFIDALCFGLFKKPFRKVNLPQLVNSVTGKGLLVEVEFESRGQNYLVRRGIKPNVFEVYCDGNLVDQTLTKDYQTEFERRVLRTNYKTFVQIVILGSASYIPFMQLKSHERRPIVEDIYDCGIFTQMKVILSKQLSDAERTLNALENRRDHLNEKLELFKKHQEVRTEDKQKWIGQKQEEIRVLETKIEEVTARLRLLNEENKLLEPIVAEEKKYRSKLQEMEKIRAGINSNVRSIEKEVEWFGKNEDCPTCKQVIAPEFKTNAVSEKYAKLEEIKQGLRLLEEKIAHCDQHANGLSHAQTQHSGNKTKEYVLHAEVTTHRGNISKLQREIRQLMEEQEEFIDEAELVELESEILEKKREWADLVLQKDAMDYVNNQLKDSGIKARIIKKYSASFNMLVNAYLAKLDFFVDFHLDEEFEETIKSRGRDNFSYNSFSEGEKLRIDLAVLFAWRDIARTRASLNTNLLIMDEVMDSSLDVNGMGEMMGIIKKVSGDCNIFIISHRSDQIADGFSRILKFQKTKGFSKLLS